MTIFLETQRLILKPTKQSDFDDLFALRSDPDVMKYTEQGIQTKEDVHKFLDITVPYQKKYGHDICSVFEKSSGDFVGQAGLFRTNEDEQSDIEIGFSLHKKYWNMGYGTELVSALIQWGFDHLSILKLVAFTDINNISSQHVLLKCGMIHVETVQGNFKKYEIYKNDVSINITIDIARKLIIDQFPEYAHLTIASVEKQGHDNRTYRLGDEMLIRMPTDESYALKVPKEQLLLPKLAPHLSISIPVPIKMGVSSKDYPYPFSIYKWLEGKSLNLLSLDNKALERLAFDLAKFLKELQNIHNVPGLTPGQHNWWRGDHISVYDKGAREQIAKLSDVIDADKAIRLWERASKTKWNKQPVWIHGDFAIGNMLIKDGKLSAMIDFGGIACGDPACDLAIAWTFLNTNARNIFIKEMALDDDTWLRAKAWALWKATYELCQIADRAHSDFTVNKKIIEIVCSE